MFKKSVAILFALFLSFSFGSGALAAENGDTQKALNLIDQANVLIDGEIDKTVLEADNLLNAYINDISKVKGTAKLGSLYSEQMNYEEKLRAAEDESKKTKINQKLDKISSEIAHVAEKLSKESTYFSERTAQYQSELDTLINVLDILTRQMTADTIAQAAELGVTAECSWKYVKIGHKWVWIDPVKVVTT